MGRLEQCIFIQIPYPLDCNPRVLFFKMSFWVGVNSKNPSISGLFDQKVDFLTKNWGFIQEKPQKQDFSISWGSIQEWGCNQADTVSKIRTKQNKKNPNRNSLN